MMNLLRHWLWLFCVLFAGSVLVPSATWGYDVQTHQSSGYDGVSFSAFNYDSATTLSANEAANGFVGTGDVFAKCVEFIAAKGANGLPLGPGAMNINELAAMVPASGKYDAGPLGSADQALALARKAFPDAVQLPPAIPGKPYPSPPKGVKKWFQLHPAEPGVNELPHVKYADWTSGKKGSGGSWGHIFFEE